jgi:predicted Fe-Mo cluster-binding NifX family protein
MVERFERLLALRRSRMGKIMAIALAASQNHIATVFDSADSFVIIDAGAQEIMKVETLPPELTAMQMIKTLRDMKITVLLCGAISSYSQHMIETADILVIPFLKGDLKDIVAGFFSNRLNEPTFYLPGCHRGWQRMAMGKRWETLRERAEITREQQKKIKL